MTLRRALAISPVLFALAAAAPACGARSVIVDGTTPATGGGGAGGGGGATTSSSTTSTTSSTSTSSSTSTTSSSSSSGTGGGANHPVISDYPGSILQAETHVIAAPNGIVSVAWIDVDGQGNSNIGYTFSTNDGESFASASLIFSPENRVSSDPVLAADAAGNIYVTWVGYKIGAGGPSSMRIYVSIAPAGTTTFGDPIQVSPQMDGEALYDKPWITVTNKGTIVVTYQRDAMPQEFGLVATRSTDGGKTWQQSFIVNDPNGNVFRNLAFPCAPKTGDRLWVTFLAFDGFGMKTKLARSDDDGATWQPEIQVSVPNEKVAFDDPNCIAEGDQVWVSYGQSKDPLDQMAGETQKLSSIQLAHSSDAGQSILWHAEVADLAAAPFFMHPQMALADGLVAHFVYYAGTMDEDPNGSYRRSRLALGVGLDPSSVVEQPITYLQARSDARWLGDYTGVHWRAGQLYTSYVVNSSGMAQVAFAKYAAP